MEEFELHTPTKQVLIEKAPFMVIINKLCTFDYSNLWYCNYSEASFLVKQATSEEMAPLLNTSDLTFKDMYVICGEVYKKGSAIYKEHCTKQKIETINK